LVVIKEEKEYHLASQQKEVDNRRQKLRLRIAKWRVTQRILMPKVGDILARQSACDIELERLYLPSDLLSADRHTVEATVLGAEEAKLREGEAFDAIRAIQNAVKSISALRGRKQKNARGQGENTRAGGYIRDAESRRNFHIQTYAAARTAMISLGSFDENESPSPFPPLALEDTFIKSREASRCLGDSRRMDGSIFRMGAVAVGARTVRVSAGNLDGSIGQDSHRDNEYATGEDDRTGKLYPIFNLRELIALLASGTQMERRKAGVLSSFCNARLFTTLQPSSAH
jgi:hypothetical protein